jgi:hypothetical protein
VTRYVGVALAALFLMLGGCGPVTGSSRSATLPASRIWTVYGPPSPGPAQFVDGLQPWGPSTLAVLMGYQTPPESGRLWWLNLRNGAWRAGPVLGQGQIVRSGSRLWFGGLIGGRFVLAEAYPHLQVLLQAPAPPRGQGSVAAAGPRLWGGVGLAGGGSMLWEVIDGHVARALRVPGTLVAVMAEGRRVFWVTDGPARLTGLTPAGARAWRLPASPLALAPDGAGVAVLLHQPLDVPGTGSLLGILPTPRAKRMRWVGIAPPVLPPTSSPWKGGAVSLVVSAGGGWTVLYRAAPPTALVARIGLANGAPGFMTSEIRPSVPPNFIPVFPVLVTARAVVAGLGNQLVIGERPVPVSPGLP